MDDRRPDVESGPARRVAGIIEPALQSMGFRLVRVKFAGRSLQIMAERPDGTMTVDDCAALSRAISPLLDVEDPIPGSYTLEVSSPGIDRPLVRLEDFERWVGQVAKVELKAPVDGRRRFRGVIEGVGGNVIRLTLPPEAGAGAASGVELAFDDVSDAKLVLTDELLAMARERAKPGPLSEGSPWWQGDGQGDGQGEGQGDEQAGELADQQGNDSDDERSSKDG